MLEEILKILPQEISTEIKKICGSSNINEIRLRVGKKVLLIASKIEIEGEYVITLKDLLDILVRISKNSIYAIQNEINNGFVVLKGGHRIGVCGEVIIEDGKIKNIKNINSMNIRVARQLIGCSDKVLPYIIKNNEFTNTLIVSPPGCGKTTMLRDIIRQLSNGIKKLNFSGKNVGLVDERGEIAAVSQGIANLDVGLRTDIMSNVPKYLGMQMLVRSMGIDIIATDEIGSIDDINAIKYANCSGVSLIFTMHGKDLNDILGRYEIKNIIEENLFRNIIILSNKRGVGTVEKIYDLKEEKDIKEKNKIEKDKIAI